jgi:hypothetical protein
VVREVGCALGLEHGVLLEQLGDAAVHRPPPRGRNAGVDAARDQVVREAQAAVCRQQHRMARRGGERFADGVPVEAREPGQRGRIDARREHGRPAQHLAAVGVEACEALLEHFTQRLPAFAGHFGARELDREQRVAAALFAEAFGVGRRRARADDLAHGVLAERFEIDFLEKSRSAQVAQRT